MHVVKEMNRRPAADSAYVVVGRAEFGDGGVGEDARAAAVEIDRYALEAEQVQAPSDVEGAGSGVVVGLVDEVAG